jgi:hypothetical protein
LAAFFKLFHHHDQNGPLKALALFSKAPFFRKPETYGQGALFQAPPFASKGSPEADGFRPASY